MQKGEKKDDGGGGEEEEKCAYAGVHVCEGGRERKREEGAGEKGRRRIRETVLECSKMGCTETLLPYLIPLSLVSCQDFS